MLKKRIKLTIRKWQLYALHYSLSGGKKAPGGVIIVMLNNLIQQGGLLDRIKGIITAQAIADEIGYTLKVHVDEKTFNLFSFLQPVNPATVATDNDVSYSVWQSRLVIIYNLVALTRQQVLHFFSNKKYQYHFYCNLDMLKQFYPGKTQNELNDVWRNGFNRLFKFDNYFVRYAQDVFKGETAICGIHLRFISLLGDFKEAVDNSLPPQQKQALINKCIEHTKKIIQSNAHKKYLVVADSITFLHALRDTIKMEDYAGNVVILDGPIAHIDFDHSGEVLQKTVLDFYLLSRCSTVYQVRAEGMYRSQFCRYAAVLGNAPYHEEKI